MTAGVGPGRLPRPCLALITDRRLSAGRTLESIVRDAVRGGVDLVQVREKDLPAAELFALCRRLRDAVGETALVVVNDRLDVALAADLDGVHLPETGLPVEEARRLAPGLLIGVSVHSAEAAAGGIAAGADYVQFGTVFPSRSKPGRAAAGLAELRTVCAAAGGIVVAVGGVESANAAEAVQAGANGAAVISAVMAAAEPFDAARRLKLALRAKVEWYER